MIISNLTVYRSYTTCDKIEFPLQDLIIKPRYLITFTVGIEQKKNIDDAVKKVIRNYTIYFLLLKWAVYVFFCKYMCVVSLTKLYS